MVPFLAHPVITMTMWTADVENADINADDVAEASVSSTARQTWATAVISVTGKCTSHLFI